MPAPAAVAERTKSPNNGVPAEFRLSFCTGAEDEAARVHREQCILRPGTRVQVNYRRGVEDIGQEGHILRIEMGYRFDNDESRRVVVASGERDAQGQLVRHAPVLDVPDRPGRELQVWFRLDMEDGRTLWDSAWGRNYRFAVSY